MPNETNNSSNHLIQKGFSQLNDYPFPAGWEESISQEKISALKRILWVTAKLRDPQEGCPWDLKQDHQSLKQYLIEESYEFLEALEEENPKEMAKELGDLLFQVTLHSQVAEDNQNFDISDVANSISEKLITRHPHVFFGDKNYNPKDEWEKQKRKNEGKKRVLDGLPKHLPALQRASRMSEKVSRFGFDFPTLKEVLGKIDEEMSEVMEGLKHIPNFNKGDEIPKTIKDKLFWEIGDHLFSITNLARYLEIDPEAALQACNARFQTRFNRLEEIAASNGKPLEEHTLSELDSIWNQVKYEENGIK